MFVNILEYLKSFVAFWARQLGGYRSCYGTKVVSIDGNKRLNSGQRQLIVCIATNPSIR